MPSQPTIRTTVVAEPVSRKAIRAPRSVASSRSDWSGTGTSDTSASWSPSRTSRPTRSLAVGRTRKAMPVPSSTGRMPSATSAFPSSSRGLPTGAPSASSVRANGAGSPLPCANTSVRPPSRKPPTSIADPWVVKTTWSPVGVPRCRSSSGPPNWLGPAWIHATHGRAAGAGAGPEVVDDGRGPTGPGACPACERTAAPVTTATTATSAAAPTAPTARRRWVRRARRRMAWVGFASIGVTWRADRSSCARSSSSTSLTGHLPRPCAVPAPRPGAASPALVRAGS